MPCSLRQCTFPGQLVVCFDCEREKKEREREKKERERVGLSVPIMHHTRYIVHVVAIRRYAIKCEVLLSSSHICSIMAPCGSPASSSLIRTLVASSFSQQFIFYATVSTIHFVMVLFCMSVHD